MLFTPQLLTQLFVLINQACVFRRLDHVYVGVAYVFFLKINATVKWIFIKNTDSYLKMHAIFYWLRAWTLKSHDSIQILVSPVTGCVVSGKSVDLSEPQFLFVWNVNNTVTYLLGLLDSGLRFIQYMQIC